ncbi:MAG: ATP-binding cassette domain-containing protein [Armatimonadota bacterium]|nr:ATP-binding cassette domain-containing protein [Armatimonadota bacterium]MDR7404363.1 ATP-binding cassette domain-containing protein [Armatimonadota bacterium]MDR7545640.1 ATP-binding cassette domain-containing protein [Armatimonadota bacterium]
MAALEPHPHPLLEARGIYKAFGKVQALAGVDFHVGYQEVVGLVGDNGAGKSTLIKILTGVYPPDAGELFFEGQRITLRSPKEARALGIETVYQDLALVEQMSIARNFFLGNEPVRRIGPVSLLDTAAMHRVTEQVLREIGITTLRSAAQDVGVLSGGERQAIAIGRTMHFGAKLIILDEPTSALSVKETRKVLDYIQEAKRRGLSVIFITHNLYHVYPVSDRIVVLAHGRKVGDFARQEVSIEDLVALITLPQGVTPSRE